MNLAEWLLLIVAAYGLYRLLGRFQKRLEDRLLRLFRGRGPKKEGRVINLSDFDKK